MRFRMKRRRRPLSFLKAVSTVKVSPVLVGWAPNGLPLLQLRRIINKNIVNGQAEAGGGPANLPGNTPGNSFVPPYPLGRAEGGRETCPRGRAVPGRMSRPQGQRRDRAPGSPAR